jgi:hypothetical protein
MRENLSQPIKICGTRTNPAAETKSIGLPADAQVPCFLLVPRLFRRDTQLRCRLSGPAAVSQLHRDPKLSAISRDWQKTRHRDADVT